MAAVQNGHADDLSDETKPITARWGNIPDHIDIPVREGDIEEAVEVNLIELLDDPTELCTLLENENVEKRYWMTIALAYAKQRKVDHAIQILSQALQLNRRSEEKLSLLSCLCWMFLWKCRDAPRVRPEGQPAAEARTKDYYIHSATSTLNDASRISPSYPPLFLARGVLSLLRASLQPPSKASGGTQDNSERVEALRQASKCFDDALRASKGTNMMATLGKARVFFSMGKYGDALQTYQAVVERAPDLIDPDPRIGIGCCLWQLGHKDDAKAAWERCLELTPNSKTANILLGLYHLHISSQFLPDDPRFKDPYSAAMTTYTQRAWKIDNDFPLASATFGSYFLSSQKWRNVAKLARKAIELTDVNAIASDGWYLLARMEHSNEETAKANEYYLKADQARGGDDRGFVPAKLGSAQVRVLMRDHDGAKFRLEKLLQTTKCVEAMALLGALYAEDVFSNQVSNVKEDRSTELKKAISLLEAVRMASKDPKKTITKRAEMASLYALARLYETDYPEKSLQCLLQVEKVEVEILTKEHKHKNPHIDLEDEAIDAPVQELLPPSLLNNMGCFQYQAEKYSHARELFQNALNACVKTGDDDPSRDTDALVTTVSYNLARTYEAEGMLDEAKRVYEGLLARHPDYTDANTRLAYIALKQSPTDEGPKAVQKIFQSEPGDIEVRSLYGHYLSKSKRRTQNIAEDQEQRHYKHTLQQFDKHDRYSLTGMGNIYLSIAREMRRDTDQDKDKRRKMYEKAVEFFDKALQLDSRNAYAAQGIGIAMVEDKKDFAAAVQIFSKVRETMKDASVYINLGHAYCELKQYSRAIESYDAALAKGRQQDHQILACLGRVWLQRGRQEKSLPAMKTSLEFSRRALAVAPEQIHFKFNVAFVQMQIAQLLHSLPETQRTLEELEIAASGLDDAIESLSAIAKSPNPPFPRNDIEQRASMGRNTMRKQLERAMSAQKEYEEKNAARLQQARDFREAEIRKRDEEKRRVEEAANEARRRVQEERKRMQERDLEVARQRADEERAREDAELTTDSETGEKRKREKRKKLPKRKKKADETDGEGATTEGGATGSEAEGSGEDRPRKKKKRRLERRPAKIDKPSKYKSAEMVVDSDEESDEAVKKMNGNEKLAEKVNAEELEQEEMRSSPNEGEDDDAAPSHPRKKVARVIEEDDDDSDGTAGNEVSMPDVTAAGGVDVPQVSSDEE